MEKSYGNDYEILEVRGFKFHGAFVYGAFATNLRRDPTVGL